MKPKADKPSLQSWENKHVYCSFVSRVKMKYIGNAYAALSPVFWLLIQIMYNELVSHAVSGT